MKQGLLLALLVAVPPALTSCSSTINGPIDDKTPGATYQKGVPGGTLVETYKLTATVTGIDAPSRKITLVGQDGQKKTVTCSQNVINFDQIQVGDVVKVTVTDELTVAMANAAAAPGTSTTTSVALAPKGAKPAALMVETQQYTARITAIDLKQNRVTLHFPDDTSRTFVVRKDVDLNQRKIGEEVTFRSPWPQRFQWKSQAVII
jgi:Cu/Ag efflux protein CusF